MKQRHTVLLSLGSDTEREKNIALAFKLLKTEVVENAEISKILTTKDIRGTGTLFSNALVSGDTMLSLPLLREGAKAIERTLLRGEKITIDIDILMYDGEKHKQKDWERPYIKPLLDDLNGKEHY